jgi:hypothetical protein
MEIKGMGRPSWPTRLTPSDKIEHNTSFREVLQLRISQANPASSATGPESKAAVLGQGEKVLDLLDDFAQALADPQKTLKDLEPLVLKMEGEVRDLETAPGSEADSDQGLSRLMSDASLLANVALLKFRRGDYL